MKLTKEEQRKIALGGTVRGLDLREEERLGTDNHGVGKVLMIMTDGVQNFGVYYEETSEEITFEDQKVFEVYPKEILKTVWKRSDKKSHWE